MLRINYSQQQFPPLLVPSFRIFTPNRLLLIAKEIEIRNSPISDDSVPIAGVLSFHRFPSQSDIIRKSDGLLAVPRLQSTLGAIQLLAESLTSGTVPMDQWHTFSTYVLEEKTKGSRPRALGYVVPHHVDR